MERHCVLNYKGNTYVCTEDPVLVEEKDGICTFSGFRQLYLCDPEKNTKCAKKGCQERCFKTFNVEFSVSDSGKRHTGQISKQIEALES